MRKLLAAVALGALLLAACSSSPQDSLANDQRTLNGLQTAVANAQAEVSTDQTNVAADMPAPADECTALQQAGSSCTPTRHHLNQDEAQEAKDEATLKADEFKLQVAQDQLKKDESSG